MSVYVSGNYAYVSSAGSDALEIVDISDPTAPFHAGRIVDEDGGALLGTPQSVYVSGDYAYVASTGSNALEIIHVPIPAPTVNGITPDTGVNTGPVSITNLSGTRFLNGAGVNLTQLGQTNLTATGVFVQSPSNITCTFDLTGATVGQWNIVVTNPDGQEGTLADGFTITAPAPAPKVTGITPDTGVNTGPVSITNLAGTNFNTTTMPTVNLTRSVETNLTATEVATPSDTQITCTFDLNGAAAGPWNVVVTNPDDQSGTLENGFWVFNPSTHKIGIFRNGGWWLDFNSNGVWDEGTDHYYYWGASGDTAVVGDWDGDDDTDIGIFRDGGWWLDFNSNGVWDAGTDHYYYWGASGDTPVFGRWS